ncbi:MAG TPA: polysaccharide biosynthesis tyrosine autokinase [Solirubrobacterales bacterium]|nr:polysaccharide biosynthesis tyrosine autokinase [Solirubrobacterales bacterium]
MEFRELLQLFWRRRWLIVLVVVATTALAAAFALTRTDEYESVSTIAMTPSTAGAGFVTPDTLDALLGTYAQTAQSEKMRVEAESETGEEIEGKVETGTHAGTGILEITGVADSPAAAEETSVAISRAFVNYIGYNKLFDPEIVDPASLPTSPAGPSDALIIAIGILLGLIAGAMLAYAVEQVRGRIERASDVAAVTALPIIGVLPRERKLSRSPSRLIWEDLNLSGLQEGIRALRTNLELLMEDGTAVVQVTSPVAGEGKSMIVANLGVALAQIGVETLIVDADLRRPSQHEIFNVSNDLGVSNLLTGGSHTKVRRATTPYENLTLLPSGPQLPNSTEMLHVRGRSLIETLRGTGAFVLVDSPPLLPVSDARILAGRADHVILTVSANKEKPSTLRSAIESLQFAGASILGVVLNQAMEDTQGYDYYRPTTPKKKQQQPAVNSTS